MHSRFNGSRNVKDLKLLYMYKIAVIYNFLELVFIG